MLFECEAELFFHFQDPAASGPAILLRWMFAYLVTQRADDAEGRRDQVAQLQCDLFDRERGEVEEALDFCVWAKTWVLHIRLPLQIYSSIGQDKLLRFPLEARFAPPAQS